MANANKLGLVFGAAFGAFHFVWSLLVLLGWGQVFLDFVMWAHMIHFQYQIGPFDIAASATLIVFTAVYGYVIGYVVALIWNRIHPA